MKPDFLDRYSRLKSPVHHLPAWIKLLAAMAMVAAALAVPASRAWVLGIVAALLVAVAAISRVPPPFLMRRLLTLEPLAIMIASLALLQPNGVRVFGLLVARSTLCLAIMVLLSSTTPFAEVLRVLRRIHTPALLVTTLALMYRYLFVLFDEHRRMRDARLSRTFRQGRWRAWKSLGSSIGQLFVRASERSERIYAAMTARGWR